MKLTLEQIDQIKIFFSDKPVKKVYLFGSYARGEANENSDVDLLIDWDYSRIIGLYYVFWWEEIKELLHKDVDFVSLKYVSPLIENYVNEDKIMIYEA
jgi:predicted nucleotidyltransferase